MEQDNKKKPEPDMLCKSGQEKWFFLIQSLLPAAIISAFFSIAVGTWEFIKNLIWLWLILTVINLFGGIGASVVLKEPTAMKRLKMFAILAGVTLFFIFGLFNILQ